MEYKEVLKGISDECGKLKTQITAFNKKKEEKLTPADITALNDAMDNLKKAMSGYTGVLNHCHLKASVNAHKAELSKKPKKPKKKPPKDS